MPRSVEETGIGRRLLLDLMLKIMYVSGTQKVSALAREARLSIAVVTEIVEEARELALIETLGLRSTDNNSDLRFNLTSKGIEWAANALNLSQYVGPVPVTLASFSEQVERQSLANEQVERDLLEAAFSGLVLPDDLLERLGPAANSAKSLMLYGGAGNGKTCIAEAIAKSFRDTISIPYAIEVDGQVINYFDELVHRRVGAANGDASGLRVRDSGDARWVTCRRPVTLVGGELSLEMLDLIFNPVGKYYEAPAQLKATGGVFVIDDFGRQRAPATNILNRWVVPLERRLDYLSLHTGKKFPVPFDELVIFSTNMQPSDIGDGALLRRLYYKIEVPEPTSDDYAQIWRNVSDERDVPFSNELMTFVEDEILRPGEVPRAGYHARYVFDQVAALCHYRGETFRIDKPLLYQACKNLFSLPELRSGPSLPPRSSIGGASPMTASRSTQ